MFIMFFLLFSFAWLSGCETMNNNPENKRFWYPSLQTPNYLNEEAQSVYTEGCDPYLDPTVGPRSLQARGAGYDLPRSRTTQILGSQPVVINNAAPNLN